MITGGALILAQKSLSVFEDITDFRRVFFGVEVYIAKQKIAHQSSPIALSRLGKRCIHSAASSLQAIIVLHRLALSSLKITAFHRFHNCQQHKATKVLKCFAGMCGEQFKK